MSDKIELKSVRDIFGMNFYIPKYQRGYRWTKQQVIDLLNDIKEFMERKPGDDEIYCLQPLVVKKKDDDTFKRIKEEAQNLIEVEALLKGSWDVIDGQQRLTTIKILLACLEEQGYYNIEYETRGGSKDFLSKISNDGVLDKFDDNIDFYHMRQAKGTIQTWLGLENNDNPSFKETFKETLLNNVKFIWYKSTDEDPIKVFTRLNIGKIPLTDAELIKALFLNQSNFSHSENTENIRLYQQEIAAEWDNIEYTLQNDEFWLFIHSPEWNKPTRIDFIFDLMRKKECFGKIEEKCIGEDEHKSFRYFYEYFKAQKKNIDGSKLRDEIWRKVKEYFQIFQEWYNDLELYHYVGYLVDRGDILTLQTLLCKWMEKSSKDSFEDYLIDQIKGKLNKCSDLTRKYGDTGENKTECLPLLLLFNIQTVINQNKELVNSDKYGVGTFYKFPFHLFKKEGKKANGKGWEIEHIASNAGDDLTKLESQKIFLASIKYSYELKDELKKQIDEFINGTKGSFEELRNSVWKEFESKNSIPDGKKNYIWNFALLDSATNEEYQNNPFPVKRICVLAKEQGKKAKLGLNENNELKISYENGIAFVPPCTRNVFTKAYTEIPTALNSWTLDDAGHYLKKMNEVLCGAGFIQNQNAAIEEFIKGSNSTEKNNG